MSSTPLLGALPRALRLRAVAFGGALGRAPLLPPGAPAAAVATTPRGAGAAVVLSAEGGRAFILGGAPLLGDTYVTAPLAFADAEPVAALALGGAAVPSLALISASGRVAALGAAGEGQLGLGGVMGPAGSYGGGTQRALVVAPAELPRAAFGSDSAAVAAAALAPHHSLFATRCGRVFAAGSSFSGALGLGLGAPPFAMAPEPLLGLPDAQADPAVAVGAGLAFSLVATRAGRLFFCGRLGHGGVVRGGAAASAIVAAAAAGPASLASTVPLELPLLTPRADDPAPGLRLRIACGLHHALVSLAGRPGAQPLERPRLWVFGLSRAGALGTGSTNDTRLAPLEIDLDALLPTQPPEHSARPGSAPVPAGNSPSLAASTSLASLAAEAMLETELPVAAGPYSSAFALRGRVFVAGRLESPLLLGSLGRNAAAAAGKSADEVALMRDLGLLGEDEAGAASLASVAAALEAADTTGVVLARAFVPVLDEAEPGPAGARALGRVVALSLGAAHAAALELP